MAQAHAADGDGAQALQHARLAGAIATRGPADVRWTSLQSLAGIERQFKHDEASLQHYRESLAVIESLRGRVVHSAHVRAGFLEGKQAVYGATIELLFERGGIAQALEIAERSRARAFLDQLSSRDLVTKRVDPAALARIAALEEQLRRDTVSRPAAPPARSGPADRGGLSPSGTPIPSMPRHDRGELIATSALTSVDALEEARQSGETFVEYFSGTDRLFIWVVSSRRIHGVSVDIGRRQLADLVGAVRARMGADGGAAAAAAAEWRPLLRRLHGLLIEPVRHLLPADPDRAVTIIPHGPLFLLSFAALLDENGRYLVEHHALSYSPSISALRYIRRNRVAAPSAPRVLAIGNPAMPEGRRGAPAFAPLPGAEREARAIAHIFGAERVTPLVGSRASERTARELAPAQNVIHLATPSSSTRMRWTATSRSRRTRPPTPARSILRATAI